MHTAEDVTQSRTADLTEQQIAKIASLCAWNVLHHVQQPGERAQFVCLNGYFSVASKNPVYRAKTVTSPRLRGTFVDAAYHALEEILCIGFEAARNLSRDLEPVISPGTAIEQSRNESHEALFGGTKRTADARTWSTGLAEFAEHSLANLSYSLFKAPNLYLRLLHLNLR